MDEYQVCGQVRVAFGASSTTSPCSFASLFDISRLHLMRKRGLNPEVSGVVDQED
jgi:hypothetical protein